MVEVGVCAAGGRSEAPDRRNSRWSHIARKEGLLSLEAYISGVKDPFAVKGCSCWSMAPNRTPARSAGSRDHRGRIKSQGRGAKVWESAGGYAPTIGILAP
jgi:chemotaxis protein MotA